jgi:hypothetical protein
MWNLDSPGGEHFASPGMTWDIASSDIAFLVILRIPPQAAESAAKSSALPAKFARPLHY